MEEECLECNRCNTLTEHYWKYESKREVCVVCNDCLVALVQYMISNGTIAPHKIVDWALRTNDTSS